MRSVGCARFLRSVARRIAVIGAIVAFGLVLSGCDKCGNSIFRMEACQDKLPRS